MNTLLTSIALLYPIFRCITHIKKYRRSDPFRCFSVMKLAHSVFAYKKTVLVRAIYVTRIAPNVSMKYMQLRCANSHRFGYVVE